EAIATLDQALAIAPSDAVALNTRGAIQIERGDLAAAENSLREALKIRGDYAEARFNLALALRRRGELESAEAELDRILGSPYPLDAARLERATLHIERGDAREALRLLEALLAEYPDDPRALANAAAAHQRLGHDGE